jgi:DNA-binding transcriptional ArsR family regulator
MTMHAFEVLGEPVRRRIVGLLATGELTSGDVVTVIQREFGITQSAVSQHLRVLRDNGFATVRVSGARRLYSVVAAPLHEVDSWLKSFACCGSRASTLWQPRSRVANASVAMNISRPRAHLPRTVVPRRVERETVVCSNFQAMQTRLVELANIV